MSQDSLVLGADLLVLRVRVTTGSDFRDVLEHQDESGAATDWPVGATVDLIINGTAYPGTIAGADVAWVVSHTVSDAWSDGAVAIFKVTESGSPSVWALGTVVRLG